MPRRETPGRSRHVLDIAVAVWMVGAGLVVAWQGMRYLVDPADVVAGTEVTVASVDDRHVIRTGYAGGLLAVGAMSVLGAWRRSLRTAGLTTMAVAMAALVAARLASVAIDGAPSSALVRLLVVELVILVGTAVVLIGIRRRHPTGVEN